MKKSKFLRVLLVPLACATLVGCGGGNQSSTSTTSNSTSHTSSSESSVEAFNAVSIDTIKTTYNNNQEAQVEGVVYGITKNGYFVCDSAQTGIFVSMGDNWTPTVALKDKVQINAKFSVVNNYSMLKQATAKVVASNQTPLIVAKDKDLTFTSGLVATRNGDYGMLVNIVGSISKNGNAYAIKDENDVSVILNEVSASTLENFVGKRVAMKAIVYKCNAEGKWELVFAGSEDDIAECGLSEDEYFALAKKDLDEQIPSYCKGHLELPTEHSTVFRIKYTWSVVSGTSITITDNVATVVAPEADEEVKLKVTVTLNESTRDYEYTLTSKAIVLQSVSEFLADAVPNDGCKVKGVVVAFGRNQGETAAPFNASKRYIVIKDMATNATVPVNYAVTYALDSSIKVGDPVEVNGVWSVNPSDNTANPNIDSTSITKQVDVVESYDVEPALVASTKEDFEEIANNPDKYNGKKIRFNNPYLNYSTSSTPNQSNWIRFGYDATVSKVANKSLAVLIGLGNENLYEGWDEYFALPFSNQEGKQVGATIDAYLVYRSASYLQLCIAGTDAIQFADQGEQLKYDIYNSLPSEVEGSSTITLPSKEGVDITYSSDNELISSTGSVGKCSSNTDVTLTATFTIGDTSYTVSKVVKVLSSTTYTAEVVSPEHGSATLSKTEGIFEDEKVTLTFNPDEGYKALSFSITEGSTTTKYASYMLPSVELPVASNISVSVEYIANDQVTDFTMAGGKSGLGSAVLWYNTETGAYTSGTSGTTAQTYDYVMGKIGDADGNTIDKDVFSVSANPLSSGKWVNFSYLSDKYDNPITVYGGEGETNSFTLTATRTIYSVKITYLSETYYKRAAIYSGENKVTGLSLSAKEYTYLIDGNSFTVENVTANYLYINAIEIVYAAA